MTVHQEFTSRLWSVADAVQIPIDTSRSTVDIHLDDIAYVVAAITDPPVDDESRRLMCSALHVAILDEFDDLAQLNVTVAAPTVSKRTSPPASVTEWIKSQSDCINQWATTAALTLIRSSYVKVVEAYPWIDREAMMNRIPYVMEASKLNMAHGVLDPVVSASNVDAILPPIQDILHPTEITGVGRDICTYLGRSPGTRLEAYEVVYRMCTTKYPVSAATVQLYGRLFRA